MHTRRSTLLLLAAALILLASPPAATQAALSSAQQAVLAEVDRELSEGFAADGVGGLSIGVVSGAELVWTRNLGVTAADDGRPVTSDTVYRIGSITKQFTALALLQAVEQGRMRLTDPLEKYVPEVGQLRDRHAGTPPVTLLQVATMTSGIAREPDCEGPLDGPVSRWTAKLLECIPGTGYANEPGTAYLYSNIGYAMLGLAIERAAGTPFTAFVEQRIFVPLGMTRTAFEPTAELRRDLAHGYSRRGREGPHTSAVADRELDGRGYKVPNGAILSSVRDLARFVAWELGHGPEAVLKPATRDANFQRVYSATSGRGELALDSGYGVGFQAQRRGEVVILGHGGSTAGYHTSALFHRESQLGVVVLRSCDSCSRDVDAGPTASRLLERLVSAR